MRRLWNDLEKCSLFADFSSFFFLPTKAIVFDRICGTWLCLYTSFFHCAEVSAKHKILCDVPLLATFFLPFSVFLIYFSSIEMSRWRHFFFLLSYRAFTWPLFAISMVQRFSDQHKKDDIFFLSTDPTFVCIGHLVLISFVFFPFCLLLLHFVSCAFNFEFYFRNWPM